MPELPEVEVTKRGLEAKVQGCQVLDLYWSGKKLRQTMPLTLLRGHILGQRFLGIDRRAKYLLFQMKNGAVLLIHLGMTGKLSLKEASSKRDRHDHLALLLDQGKELRFNDSRRFGSVQVWPPEQAREQAKILAAKEGIEPFSADFAAKNLAALAAHKRLAIKAFLMNSHNIAGIGNIYANEILFAVKIHPEKPASSLELGQWQALVRHSRRILRQAIEAGGSTIADFLDASGHPGYFQLQFQVYGKAGLPCPRCAAILRKTQINGRASFFCLVCQK